jgi:hypothetical protein
LLVCFLARTIDGYINKLQLVVLRKLAIYTVYHLSFCLKLEHVFDIQRYCCKTCTHILAARESDNWQCFFGNMCVRIFQELVKRHLR